MTTEPRSMSIEEAVAALDHIEMRITWDGQGDPPPVVSISDILEAVRQGGVNEPIKFSCGKVASREMLRSMVFCCCPDCCVERVRK